MTIAGLPSYVAEVMLVDKVGMMHPEDYRIDDVKQAGRYIVIPHWFNYPELAKMAPAGRYKTLKAARAALAAAGFKRAPKRDYWER